MLRGVTSTHSSSRIISSACSSESGRGGMRRTVSSELAARRARAVVNHLLHAPRAEREQLRDDADVVLGHVDRDALHRFVALAVEVAGEHLRLADRELEAFTAHQLDEHGELQLAAALD